MALFGCVLLVGGFMALTAIAMCWPEWVTR